jgi:hypothetical protein
MVSEYNVLLKIFEDAESPETKGLSRDEGIREFGNERPICPINICPIITIPAETLHATSLQVV